MTRQVFIIISVLVSQFILLILSAVMHWETFAMIVKIGAPSSLFVMMLLSLNDNILNWFCQPIFKKKKNTDLL